MVVGAGGGRGPGGPGGIGGVRHRLDHDRRRSGSGDVLGHRPRRRRQRVAARRVLVHVGEHRAVGAGRADRPARQRRVPRERRHLRGHRRREHRQRRLQRPRRRSTACRRTPRTPTASAPTAPGRRRTRSRPRSSTARSTSCSSATRRSARPATCAKDGAGWEDTLNVSLAANPDAELLVSGGDQVETANTESQWNAFLALRQAAPVPVGRHHRQPRRRRQGLRPALLDPEHRPLRAASTRATRPPSPAVTTGTSTRTSCSSTSTATPTPAARDAAHVGYVTDVVNAHGAEAKYTVLVFHHAIYSPAAHANDGDNQQRRLDFPTAFSNLGVDLVLQGHDHSYSRSYALKNGQKANAAEQPGAAQVAQGPGGVIYVTGNSASGSKYYDLTTPRRGLGLRSGPAGPHRQAPLRELGGEPGARPHLRQGRRCARTRSSSRTSAAAPAPPRTPRSSAATCPGAARTAAPPRPSRSAPWSTRSSSTRPRRRRSTPASAATVPATLSLTLGTPAAFGPFTPGVAKDYTASTTATVISTAGDATLTAVGPELDRSGPPGQRHVRARLAAAGRGHRRCRRRSRRTRRRSPTTTSRSTSSSRSARTSRCARARTRRR